MTFNEILSYNKSNPNQFDIFVDQSDPRKHLYQFVSGKYNKLKEYGIETMKIKNTNDFKFITSAEFEFNLVEFKIIFFKFYDKIHS